MLYNRLAPRCVHRARARGERERGGARQDDRPRSGEDGGREEPRKRLQLHLFYKYTVLRMNTPIFTYLNRHDGLHTVARTMRSLCTCGSRRRGGSHRRGHLSFRLCGKAHRRVVSRPSLHPDRCLDTNQHDQHRTAWERDHDDRSVV